MYSIASQLFEGLVHEAVNTEERQHEEGDHQKGEHGSGRLMADIVSEKTVTQERKFLYDYAYLLFEKELENKGKILDINNAIDDEAIRKHEGGYVRIHGHVTFVDIKNMIRMLDNYITMCRAFAYIQGGALIERKIEEKRKRGSPSSGKSNSQTKKKNIREESEDEVIREILGNVLDEKYLESLRYLIQFGFEESFEIEVDVPDRRQSDRKYIGLLDENFLREPKNNIVTTYSMLPDYKFTLFGRISRFDSLQEANLGAVGSNEHRSMREALLHSLKMVGNFDRTIIDGRENDIRVDPIAVYQTVS